VNAQHISDEDLVLYSMQSLSAGETSAVDLHLESCPECRHRLAETIGDLALLSLSVEQQPVPEGSRERFLSRIATEPQAVTIPAQAATVSQAAPLPKRTPVATPLPEREPAPRHATIEPKPRRNWFPVLIPWAVAFALMILAGYLGSQNQKLNDLLDADKGQIASLSAQTAQARDAAERITDLLRSPAAKQVILTEGKVALPPIGHTSYLAEKGALLFVGNNLKPIPANKTYELWIIPADGKAPIPAGLFRPDDKGQASVVLPKLPEGVPAKAIAVTIENAEGSATPTMPIVLSGAAGI
jgi:anti-sigma factor RsiW